MEQVKDFTISKYATSKTPTSTFSTSNTVAACVMALALPCNAAHLEFNIAPNLFQSSISTQKIDKLIFQPEKSVAILIKQSVDFAEKHNFEPPNDQVSVYAQKFIDELKSNGLKYSSISASQEGGLMIEFLLEENYSMVEIFNDGDVVFLVRGTEKTSVWDFNHENFISKINDHFSA